MRKRITIVICSLLVLALCSCAGVGDKSAGLSAIYMIMAVLSALLLAGYCIIAGKIDPYFLLLFSCVFVVNLGYLLLSVSQDLPSALFANRVAYLGSVFLPFSMWMIILRITQTPYKKYLPAVMLCICAVVFLVAASQGILPIYYKEVTFQKINGVTVLNKVYGPLHKLYLFYLLGYFALMVISIFHAAHIKKENSPAYAVILAIAVFVNIGVWLIEQLVRIDFELLSVSYIISEAFLLGLHLLVRENQKQPVPAQDAPNSDLSPAPTQTGAPEASMTDAFMAGVALLTPKEREIFDLYVAGQSTKDIMQKLNIKENTLKFHNKNIYAKLGISSRKQLVALALRSKEGAPSN